MKCDRIGGCLHLWNPAYWCLCDYNRVRKEISNETARAKHLSDVELVNQNGRGK